MITRVLLLLSTMMLLSACMGGGQAPISTRGSHTPAKPEVVNAPLPNTQGVVQNRKHPFKSKPTSYLVNKGDTLYSIAWRYQLDFHDLAQWNQIAHPYLIYPGDRLRLKKSDYLPTKPHETEKIVKVSPAPAAKKPIIKTTPAPEKIQKKPAQNRPLKWQWPTKGKWLKPEQGSGKNGIDILGKKGQLIAAAASGEVVYSGSGLVGYGKLIILKHNETFLSAYAHNSELLVTEGTIVKAGQTIAKMGHSGTTGSSRDKLYFEIRKGEKSIYPLKYLPKQ